MLLFISLNFYIIKLIFQILYSIFSNRTILIEMKEHTFNIPKSMITSINALGTSIKNISNTKKIQNY
jgi:hypothetical protein